MSLLANIFLQCIEQYFCLIKHLQSNVLYFSMPVGSSEGGVFRGGRCWWLRDSHQQPLFRGKIENFGDICRFTSGIRYVNPVFIKLTKLKGRGGGGITTPPHYQRRRNVFILLRGNFLHVKNRNTTWIFLQNGLFTCSALSDEAQLDRTAGGAESHHFPTRVRVFKQWLFKGTVSRDGFGFWGHACSVLGLNRGCNKSYGL